MRSSRDAGRGFGKRIGGHNEGHYVADEVEAVKLIAAQNHLVRIAKREEREAANKAKIMAKITLPKLKFMGEK